MVEREHRSRAERRLQRRPDQRRQRHQHEGEREREEPRLRRRGQEPGHGVDEPALPFLAIGGRPAKHGSLCAARAGERLIWISEGLEQAG